MDALARDVGDGIRYGLCAIGNFTIVSVIPIKNRSPSEIIRGLTLIFEKSENQSSYIQMKNQVYGHNNSLDWLMRIVLKLFRHQHMHILLGDL